MAYDHLLAPGRIGSLELRNRILVTAMGVNLSDEDGHWGDRIAAYHEEQARGGAGLIISGACGVMYPVGQVQPWQVGISDDTHIPGLAQVVDAVHRHGARFAVQLHQGGLNAVDDTVAGRPQWCPSAPRLEMGDFVDGFLLPELEILASTGMPTFKELDDDDIRDLVSAFAAGARRAAQAGCDAVEVHGGHGYVPSSFLSPKTNRRTDEYGGPLENRARLLLEIVRAVRAEVGSDFPLIVKIDSREVGKEGGISLEDAKVTAQWLENAGADAITVSAYHDFAQGKLHSASNIPHEPNWNLPAAAAIKRGVSIPIIASGRVEVAHADAEIAQGHFDFLGMGRKLLADPHLPRKLGENREREIRPCIYCYTCVSAIYNRASTQCAVNPECGIEYTRDAAPTKGRTLRVAVVGGGPAGMETARRLAEHGHETVLFEKSERLGGTLRFASLAYAANEPLLDWLRTRVEAAPVELKLGTEASAHELAAWAPDAVVVATGARRSLPDIPGADLPHVLSGDDMRDLMLGASSDALQRKTSLSTRLATRVGAATGLTRNLAFVRKATRGWMPFGKRIVVVGGELVGLELAEFLTERGRQVTVVDDVPRFGAGITLVRRLRMLAELREHEVALFPSAKDICIEPDGVRFTNAQGETTQAPADHVIVAKGTTGDTRQAEALREAGLRVYEIGDGTGVGYIGGAIRDAMEVVDTLHAELRD